MGLRDVVLGVLITALGGYAALLDKGTAKVVFALLAIACALVLSIHLIWRGTHPKRGAEGEPPAPRRYGFVNRETGDATFRKKPKFGQHLDVGFDNAGKANLEEGGDFD